MSALAKVVLRVRSSAAVLLAALACATVAQAQAQAQAQNAPFRIGLLVLHTSRIEERVVEQLRARGLVEGAGVVFERRLAQGRPERLAPLAADLVRSKVDVLVAFTNAAAFAARDATSTIPIVVWGAHDAVGTGLVTRLARPGGNVTGVDSVAPSVDAKRVQLLRELLPDMTRLGVLNNPNERGTPLHMQSTREAAHRLGLTLSSIEISSLDGVDRALAAIEAGAPEALLTFTDPMTNGAFDRVAAHARSRRLPTFCEFREFVQRGCLISYGATLAELNERVAHMVERIRQGAKPADLPMEQPTRFELVLNEKVAREIGVVFPAAIRLRADHVVE